MDFANPPRQGLLIRLTRLVRIATLVGWLGPASSARARTDEIQVYDAAIAPLGAFNLTVHNNFTPSGSTAAAFPGAVVPDKSLNGAAEWAYGAAPWFEAGLYFPLYTITRNGGVFNKGINT